MAVSSPEPDPTSVDVVLPCLDEAAALPWVLERVPPGRRALVVDNGSTDGSDRVARGVGATVVREERRGFGAACHAGLTAATAGTVCFCGCDASPDPAGLVLGRRRPRTRGARPALVAPAARGLGGRPGLDLVARPRRRLVPERRRATDHPARVPAGPYAFLPGPRARLAGQTVLALLLGRLPLSGR
ncbi:glycosyltransferase [Streptomyces griseomycini]|uniref:glycosyltransferase family 2 protein n=1 Tax=Streptomyces griseomycini TaxID=66895 RepID=UPI00341507FF